MLGDIAVPYMVSLLHSCSIQTPIQDSNVYIASLNKASHKQVYLKSAFIFVDRRPAAARGHGATG